MWNATKAFLEVFYREIQVYLRKQERSEINNLILLKGPIKEQRKQKLEERK